MTREEFEKCEPQINTKDGLNYIKEAQPDCKTCNGYGIVDIGDWHCILARCPDCWRIK